MNNIEISGLIIDLILLIKSNDIENVKNIVNQINELTNESTSYLDDFFAMNVLLQNYNNSSLIYVIKNLNQLNNKYLYMWTSQVNNLLKYRDITKIDAFINEHTAPELGEIPQYQFRDLIKLATITKNDQLQKLKLLLAEGRVV